MWRTLPKVRNSVFYQQNSCQQPRCILWHGGIATRDFQYEAQTIIMKCLKAPFRRDFQVFIYGADNECCKTQDGQGAAFTEVQHDITDNEHANGDKEAHSHMSGEVKHLLMIGQRIRKYKAKVHDSGQQCGPYHSRNNLFSSHFYPFFHLNRLIPCQTCRLVIIFFYRVQNGTITYIPVQGDAAFLNGGLHHAARFFHV